MRRETKMRCGRNVLYRPPEARPFAGPPSDEPEPGPAFAALVYFRPAPLAMTHSGRNLWQIVTLVLAAFLHVRMRLPERGSGQANGSFSDSPEERVAAG